MMYIWVIMKWINFEKKTFKKGLQKGKVQQDESMSESDAKSESSKRAM